MASWVLATHWFGTFLYDGDELVDTELFPARADAIADRLAAIREDEILDEERRLVDEADGAVGVRHERLLELAHTTLGDAPRAPEDSADHGVDSALRHEAAIELAEATIHDNLSEESRHLVQAVSYLDESHEIENQMGERLTSWFQLHAPDVVDRVDDALELARLVAQHGEGPAIAKAQGFGEDVMGSPLDPNELRAVQGLASSLVHQAEARAPLERFVDDLARDLAPNVSKLTSPTIAARLIQHAGGLEDLAKLPASTIQMLGAEQAVFKHLTEGADPPKHGVIFQHPLVHQAHPNDRGSIARALAAKIAIAARADAFTGNDIAGELLADVKARAEEVSREGRRRAMKAQEGGS